MTGQGIDYAEALHQAQVHVYLRYRDENELALFRFEEIRERYFSGDFKYVTGLITLDNLQRIKNDLNDRNVFIAGI